MNQTEQPKNTTSSKWFGRFLTLVCLMMSVEVFLLSRQNTKLGEVAASVTQQKSLEVRAHQNFGAFTLIADDGTILELKYGPEEPKTLLLVFTAGSAKCESIISALNEFHSTRHLRILGVRLNDNPLSNLGEDSAAAFPVYNLMSHEQTNIGGVHSVPTLLFLDENGVVIQTWQGPPDEWQIQELRKIYADSIRTSLTP